MKSIFCILNRKLDRVDIKTLFISENTNEAKIWFQGWMEGTPHPENHVLFKIGEIDNELNITKFKIFICTGLQVVRQTIQDNTKFIQTKLYEAEKLRQDKEIIRSLYNSKVDFKEILKTAFHGREIKDNG